MLKGSKGKDKVGVGCVVFCAREMMSSLGVPVLRVFQADSQDSCMKSLLCAIVQYIVHYSTSARLTLTFELLLQAAPHYLCCPFGQNVCSIN